MYHYETVIAVYKLLPSTVHACFCRRKPEKEHRNKHVKLHTENIHTEPKLRIEQIKCV